MMKPGISIIIPVYRAEKCLPRCLNSIISQTFTDFELILIDDGSPDNSGKICDEYTKIDNRIKSFHINNSGPSLARNMGLDNAIGEYVLFVDSDDYVASNMLQDIYYSALDCGADFVSFGIYVMAGSKAVYQSVQKGCILKNKLEIRENVIDIINHRNFGFVIKYYKRDLIEKKGLRFEDYVVGEDIMFNIEALSVASCVLVIEKPLYYYIDNNYSSLSKKFHQNRYDLKVIIFLKYKNLFIKWGIYEGRLKSNVTSLHIAGAMHCIIEMFNKNLEIKYREKINYITILLRDCIIKECLVTAKSDNSYHEMSIFLFKIGNVHFIYVYAILIATIKMILRK